MKLFRSKSEGNKEPYDEFIATVKLCSGEEILTKVIVDYSSEEDMVEKFRLMLNLESIATAIFSNSPFDEGKISKYKSLRSHFWHHTDPNRTGLLPFVFEKGFSFEKKPTLPGLDLAALNANLSVTAGANLFARPALAALKVAPIPCCPNKPVAAPPKPALPKRPPIPVPGIPKPKAPIIAALPSGLLTIFLTPRTAFLTILPNPYICLGCCILEIAIILP